MPVPSHGAGMLKISSEPVIGLSGGTRERLSGNPSYAVQQTGGSITVSSGNVSGSFSLRAYRPDGRLIGKITSTAGTAGISTKSRGIYILYIDCGTAAPFSTAVLIR